jgi:biotin-(acetyl-CoA carboxylase) ligase
LIKINATTVGKSTVYNNYVYLLDFTLINSTSQLSSFIQQNTLQQTVTTEQLVSDYTTSSEFNPYSGIVTQKQTFNSSLTVTNSNSTEIDGKYSGITADQGIVLESDEVLIIKYYPGLDVLNSTLS